MANVINGRKYSLGLQILLIVCTSCISTVENQEGFLSIDCGSDVSYNDTKGIFWETDANYTSTGRNVKNITIQQPDETPLKFNSRQMETARVFSDAKNCYVLPVKSGDTYLVRLSFLVGGLVSTTEIASGIAFDCYLDNNLIQSYNWRPDIEFSIDFFEVIYAAPRNMLNVCIIVESNTQFSFISALELRRLPPRMYTAAVAPTLNQYLLMDWRETCTYNNTGQFRRYPDDSYDRLWDSYTPDHVHSADNVTVISNNSIPGLSNSFVQDPDRPPLFVMEDAFVAQVSDIIDIVLNRLTNRTYVAAYFQELDGNASATNVRGMDFYFNNHLDQTFNISHKPLEILSLIDTGSLELNMSLVQAKSSDLGPLLNGFELHSINVYDTSATAAQDVEAIEALQVQLNTKLGWNGDPCLPVPFTSFGCNNDTPPRITALKLSSYGFNGNIPLAILNLTALTDLELLDPEIRITYLDLELNNNNFNGSIPDLTSLAHLQSIYLQQNDLSGEIPSFLGNAFVNLTKLDLDSNNLSGNLPSDLSRPGFDFTYVNNSGVTDPVAGPVAVPAVKSESSEVSIGAAVGGTSGGLIALAIVVWITWMIYTRKRRARFNVIKAIGLAENQSQKESKLSRRALAGSVTFLTLQEVSNVTKKFTNKIGEGSFGSVYHGKLPDGREVAVKVKSADSRQGLEEFVNEVKLLSQIHHRNLVSLVGCCEEENQQILLYDYVSNGTLSDLLYGTQSQKHLQWSTRLKIALNAARGLEYLHTDCHPRIIHRDIKSNNILLDENMVAKVADFGISKQAPEGVFSGVETFVKGTFGYLDPEYWKTNKLTQKSDVYSFGVVLLEIITGRHPYEDFPDGTRRLLIEWVRSAVNYGSAMDVVDQLLNGEFNKGSMTKAISIAISCTDPVTAKRPDMGQVVRALIEAMELELPSDQTDQNSTAIEAQSDDNINEQYLHEIFLEILGSNSSITF